MARWYDSLFKFSKDKQVASNGKKQSEAKPNKYNAKRTPSGFPSQLEERVYGHLLLLEKAGELSNVKRYPTYHLGGNLRWKADFSATDRETGRHLAIEAKGKEDGRFTAIKQVWPALGPCTMRIYKDAGKDRLKFVDIPGNSKLEFKTEE